MVSSICALFSRCFGSRIPSPAGQLSFADSSKAGCVSPAESAYLTLAFPKAERLRELRGTVLAPNHPSLIDAVILLVHCSPHRLHHASEFDSEPVSRRRGAARGICPERQGLRAHPARCEKTRGRRKSPDFSGGYPHSLRKRSIPSRTASPSSQKRLMPPSRPSLSNARAAISRRAFRFSHPRGFPFDSGFISVKSFRRGPRKPPSSFPRASSFIFASTWRTRARTFASSSPLESPAFLRKRLASRRPAQLQ